jgi:hypothetical protein
MRNEGQLGNCRFLPLVNIGKKSSVYHRTKHQEKVLQCFSRRGGQLWRLKIKNNFITKINSLQVFQKLQINFFI